MTKGDKQKKVEKDIFGNNKPKGWNKINDKICKIMMNDGPDGHTDGSDKITDYIFTLLNK